jgi:outer membrane protein OmpA-like peptidoglycan-associated protein
MWGHGQSTGKDNGGPIMRASLIVLSTLICLMPSTVMAGEDASERRDHPLLKRYEGAVILQHDHKAFDEYMIPLGKEALDAKFREEQFTKSVQLEGDITRILYSIPEGRSTLEVMRNYEQDLKSRGYSSLYAAGGREAERIHYISKQFDRALGNDYRFNVWKLARPEGDVHVVLYAFASIGDPMFMKGTAERGQTLLYAHVIVNKPMEANKLVDAQAMADRIADSGRVALYGIYFETNKTDLKPESEPTLQEMAKLLKAQPTLKLLVVGHTDNVGTFTSNMDLSQRRAQAVVNTLVSKYGVAKDRLTPVGDSFSAPVASNKTEEGRAKNRRVELVEQ